jgi:hypothetical protein
MNEAKTLADEIQQFVNADFSGSNINENIDKILMFYEKVKTIPVAPVYRALLFSRHALFLALQGKWNESLENIPKITALITQQNIMADAGENLFQQINSVLMTIIYYLSMGIENSTMILVLNAAMSDYYNAHTNIKTILRLDVPASSLLENFTNTVVDHQGALDKIDAVIQADLTPLLSKKYLAFSKELRQAYFFNGLLRAVNVILLETSSCMLSNVSYENNPNARVFNSKLQSAFNTCKNNLLSRVEWHHSIEQRLREMTLIVLGHRIFTMRLGDSKECIAFTKMLHESIVNPWSKLPNFFPTYFLIYQFLNDSASAEYARTRVFSSRKENHALLKQLLNKENTRCQPALHAAYLFSGLLYVLTIHLLQYGMADVRATGRPKSKAVVKKVVHFYDLNNTDSLTSHIKLEQLNVLSETLEALLPSLVFLSNNDFIIGKARVLALSFPPFHGFFIIGFKQLSNTISGMLREWMETPDLNKIRKGFLVVNEAQKLSRLFSMVLEYFIENSFWFVEKDSVANEFKKVMEEIVTPLLAEIKKEKSALKIAKTKLKKNRTKANKRIEKKRIALIEEETAIEQEKERQEFLKLKQRMLLTAARKEVLQLENISEHNHEKDENNNDTQENETFFSTPPLFHPNPAEEPAAILSKTLEAIKTGHFYEAEGLLEQLEKINSKLYGNDIWEGKLYCRTKLLTHQFLVCKELLVRILADFKKGGNSKYAENAEKGVDFDEEPDPLLAAEDCFAYLDELGERHQKALDAYNQYKHNMDKMASEAKPAERNANELSLSLLQSSLSGLLKAYDKCIAMKVIVEEQFDWSWPRKIIHCGLDALNITDRKQRDEAYQFAYEEKVLKKSFSNKEKSLESYKNYAHIYKCGINTMRLNRINKEKEMKEQYGEEFQLQFESRRSLYRCGLKKYTSAFQRPEVNIVQSTTTASATTASTAKTSVPVVSATQFQDDLPPDKLLSLLIHRPFLSENEKEDICAWSEKNKGDFTPEKAYEFICSWLTGPKCAPAYFLLERIKLTKPLFPLSTKQHQQRVIQQPALVEKLVLLDKQIAEIADEKRRSSRSLAHVLAAILTSSLSLDEIKFNLANWFSRSHPLYLLCEKLHLPFACQTDLYAILSAYVYTEEKKSGIFSVLLPPHDITNPLLELKLFFEQLQQKVAVQSARLYTEGNVQEEPWYFFVINEAAIPPLTAFHYQMNTTTILTNIPLVEMPFKCTPVYSGSKMSICHPIAKDNAIVYSLSMTINSMTIMEYLMNVSLRLQHVMIDMVSDQRIIWSEGAAYDLQHQQLCRVGEFPESVEEFSQLLQYLSWGMHLGYYASVEEAQKIGAFIAALMEMTKEKGEIFLPICLKPETLRHFLMQNVIGEGQSAGYIALAQYYGLLGCLFAIPVSLLPLSSNTLNDIKNDLMCMDDEVKEGISKSKSGVNRLAELIAIILYHTCKNESNKHPLWENAIEYSCQQLSLDVHFGQKINDALALKKGVNSSTFSFLSNTTIPSMLNFQTIKTKKYFREWGQHWDKGGAIKTLFTFFHDRTLQATGCVNKLFNTFSQEEKSRRSGIYFKLT